MNRFRFCLLFLFGLIPSVLLAENLPAPDLSPTPSLSPTASPAVELPATPSPTAGVSLEEVVVTSHRLPTPKDRVASSLSLLTAQDLERKRVHTVAQALREIPGVDVLQTGGEGRTTTVSLRGSGPARTLVFVDGVEVNDPIGSGGDGLYDFSRLTTDNVERVEVLRGSQSALYGPAAVGGVVQILTLKGQGPLRASLTGEAGGRGFHRSSLGLSGSDRSLRYALQASHLEETGRSAAEPNAFSTLPLEDDGARANNISSSLGYEPVSFLSLRLIHRYSDSETEIDNAAYDDDPNHTNRAREGLIKGEVSAELLGGDWTQTLSFSQTRQHLLDLNDKDQDHPTDASRASYQGRRDQFEWRQTLRPHSGHTLTLGFENRQEWGDSLSTYEYLDWWTFLPVTSTSQFQEKTQRVNGWYLQDQMAFGERIFLTAGVRADLHDRFGSRGTWRLAPSFLLPKWGTKLKATCGTGWRTPTLFQLYSDYGNPTLEPERSLAWDAGFEQSFLDKRLALDATLFEQRYKDYLTYDLAKWAYVNQAKTQMRGAEATLEARPYRDGAIRVSIHYTEARDQATDEILQGRPLRRASLVLDSPTFHRVRIGFECLYVGRRKNPVWLSDYTLARLRADWKPTDRLTLFGRVENLFDRRYIEYAGYQTAPRSVFGGAKVAL